MAHRARRPAAVRELDVLGRRLELVGGDGDQAVAQDRRGLPHRAGRHRSAPAAGRAGPEAGDRGVALDGRDVVDVDPERVGRELDHRGLDAVAVEPPTMYTLTLPEGSMRMVAASVAYAPKPGVDGST